MGVQDSLYSTVAQTAEESNAGSDSKVSEYTVQHSFRGILDGGKHNNRKACMCFPDTF